MFEIERLGPEVVGDIEVARLRDVRLRALADAPDAYWTTVAMEAQTTSQQWRERLVNTEAATFVATMNDADVGLVVGEPHYEDPTDAGLYAMWVAPEARGRGVGDALIAAVVAWADDAGYRSLRLEVGDSNGPAIGLYARMGFEPTGRVDTMPAPRQHITEHERARRL